jgi:hypothetical protein
VGRDCGGFRGKSTSRLFLLVERTLLGTAKLVALSLRVESSGKLIVQLVEISR